MAAQVTVTEPESLVADSLVVHFGDMLRNITDDEFFKFCQLNRDLRIERTSDGEILIMPPTGGDTGRTNSALNGLLYSWAEQAGTGITFDSSTGFTLANRAKRSPDAAWVKRSRWDALTERQRSEFPPLCPDFVAEVRSPTDSLRTLQAKMQEYIANGALLGWLIDPIEKKVYIYRPNAEVTCLDNPKTVSGDPVLPGFVLDVQRLWADLASGVNVWAAGETDPARTNSSTCRARRRKSAAGMETVSQRMEIAPAVRSVIAKRHAEKGVKGPAVLEELLLRQAAPGRRRCCRQTPRGRGSRGRRCASQRVRLSRSSCVDQFFQYCFVPPPEGNRRPLTSTSQLVPPDEETMKSRLLSDSPSASRLRLRLVHGHVGHAAPAEILLEGGLVMVVSGWPRQGLEGWTK